MMKLMGLTTMSKFNMLGGGPKGKKAFTATKLFGIIQGALPPATLQIYPEIYNFAFYAIFIYLYFTKTSIPNGILLLLIT